MIARLGAVCRRRGLESLAARLGALGALVVPDVLRLERELATVPRRDDRVGRSVHHLADLGGKRLRPLCVALAARVGRGLDDRSLQLAVAVELVHNATLLHDDVVDLGDVRRGAPAARIVYGNAASIFAGDWLLVEALRRVRESGVGDALDRLLGVIDEMIGAEAVQLERRGDLELGRDTYFRVVEGKTASLFGWATYAGACAGGLDPAACEALATYGRRLGVAFQAVDDLLDVSGDERTTGKALFADLREGKVTFPLLVALEREPTLRACVREVEDAGCEGGAATDACAAIRAAIERTGGAAECAALAERMAREAIDALGGLPEGPARDGLATVAHATVHRLW